MHTYTLAEAAAAMPDGLTADLAREQADLEARIEQAQMIEDTAALLIAESYRDLTPLAFVMWLHELCAADLNRLLGPALALLSRAALEHEPSEPAAAALGAAVVRALDTAITGEARWRAEHGDARP